jgi:hypothetical protein
MSKEYTEEDEREFQKILEEDPKAEWKPELFIFFLNENVEKREIDLALEELKAKFGWPV